MHQITKWQLQFYRRTFNSENIRLTLVYRLPKQFIMGRKGRILPEKWKLCKLIIWKDLFRSEFKKSRELNENRSFSVMYMNLNIVTITAKLAICIWSQLQNWPTDKQWNLETAKRAKCSSTAACGTAVGGAAPAPPHWITSMICRSMMAAGIIKMHVVVF